MFRKEADFRAFERVMVDKHERHPIRILSYCVLSNHWHFVVWPEEDGQLTAFFRWLATRTRRVGECYTGRSGTGIYIKDDSKVSRCRMTTICLRFCIMSSGVLCRRGWSSEHSFGPGAACGRGRMESRRLRVCYRLGRWNGQRTSTARVNAPLTARELARIFHPPPKLVREATHK